MEKAEFWHLCYAVQFCQREQNYALTSIYAMLYGSETWSVKEKDVIRLERNDARIVRWMFKIRPEDTISAEELRTRLKLKSMRECLKYRRMEVGLIVGCPLGKLPSKLEVVSPEDNLQSFTKYLRQILVFM